MSEFVGNIEDNVDGNSENGNRTTKLIMNEGETDIGVLFDRF